MGINITEDTFNISVTLFNSTGSRFESPVLSQNITTGTELSNSFEITILPNGTASIEVIKPTKLSMARQILGQIASLNRTLELLDIKEGVKGGLQAKLSASHVKISDAIKHINLNQTQPANGNLNAAINALNAFSNHLKAQKGKGVSEEDVDKLLKVTGFLISNIKTAITL